MSTDGDNIVEVPDTSCPLNDDQLQLLRQRIDLAADDGNYGISTFNQVVAEVTTLIHSWSNVLSLTYFKNDKQDLKIDNNYLIIIVNEG